MADGKPKIQVTTPCLLLRLDSPIYGPDDGIGFSDEPGPAKSAPTMAQLLLIDGANPASVCQSRGVVQSARFDKIDLGRAGGVCTPPQKGQPICGSGISKEG